MKKQIVATLVLVISAIATATAGDKNEMGISTSGSITINPTSFSKLVVEGNVDVVLFEDDATLNIRTFGNNNDMKATSITEKNGVLTIRNSKSSGEKVLIYVPVKNLAVIEASGNAKVSSAVPLQSGEITLVAKGDCKFNILCMGTIAVEQEGEVEMTVEKRTIFPKAVARL
jgi:hypothetical protein